MNKKCFALLLILAALVMQPATAVQLLDVLFLADGTSVTGVIMEEEPGKSLILENDEGQLVEYRFRDVERIEKLFDDREPLIRNRDVVYLKDGVVFRGRIVGREPDKSIRLELEEGQLLDLDLEEIFTISKEQVATGVVQKAVIKPKKEEKKRIEIHIRVAVNQLAVLQDLLKQGGEAVDSARLEDEVDSLKEEIEELEEEREVAEQEAAEEEARYAELAGELGVSREELMGVVSELEQRIAACKNRELKQRLSAKHAELKGDIAEVLQRAEVIALVEQPDPRIQEIELEQKTTNAIALASNKMWRSKDYRDEWDTLVAELPYEKRREIFRASRERNPVGPMFLNMIPLLQIGSWRQKDYLGALISTGATVVGGVLLVSGAIYNNGPNPNPETVDYLMYGGIGAALAGYAFGLVAPYLFALSYNQKLREALELDRREEEIADREVAFRESGYVFPRPPADPRFEINLIRFSY